MTNKIKAAKILLNFVFIIICIINYILRIYIDFSIHFCFKVFHGIVEVIVAVYSQRENRPNPGIRL